MTPANPAPRPVGGNVSKDVATKIEHAKAIKDSTSKTREGKAAAFPIEKRSRR